MKIRIDPLDTLFSEYIRRRAMVTVGGCERCLAQKFDVEKEDGSTFEAYKHLHCSHFIKRRNKSVRWDEDNCNGFCFGCHQYFEENHGEYEAWLIMNIGKEKFDLLQARMRITQKPDREAITLYFKQKLLEISDA